MNIKQLSEAEPTSNGISFVVPLYNEQNAIASIIEAVNSQLQCISLTSEIILVDDGSTDNTPQILLAMQQKYPHLNVPKHEGNRGYGAALKTGKIKSAFVKNCGER